MSEDNSLHQARGFASGHTNECGHSWAAQAGLTCPLHACRQGLEMGIRQVQFTSGTTHVQRST